MTQELAADPGLGRLADAILIPPFPGPRAPGWIRAALAEGLAGVTLFGPNVTGRAQLTELTSQLRAAGAEPVIAIDEEGGDVTRISHQDGSDYPGNAALGAVDDVVLTEAVYAALGADLCALGISLDLAPAVDVNTAAGNPVIGTRAFGSDTALVARHAAAAVTGLQSAGIAACAKHFPGHGSTTLDSHHVIATVDGPLGLLRRRDLPPFEAAIRAGVRAIMPSHLRVPELTGDRPASLCRAALTDLLRGELGFAGVIVSDGLEMRAVSEPYGIPEAAVLAVIAGTDLLCLGRDTDEPMFLAVRGALVDAVRDGRLTGERLEEAADRVAVLRNWAAAAASDRTGADRTGADRTTAGRLTTRGVSRPGGRVGLEAARRAVLVAGPLPPLHRPLVVQLDPRQNMAAGPVPWGLGAWLPPGAARRVAAVIPASQLPAVAAGLLAEAAGRSLVVVVRDAHRYPAAIALVQALLAARPDAVIVEMGLPVWRPPAASYLASYGAARSNGLAVAQILGLAV
jgi:beta-N-acetylhexosaminidase